MSILITGGNGFIGRYLIKDLLENQDGSIISLDTTQPSAQFIDTLGSGRSRLEFVTANICNIDEVMAVMKSFSVEKVVHLAFLMSRESEQMPRLAAKVNIVGTSNVFEAARLLSIPRVVHNSSTGAYGPLYVPGGLFEDKEVTEDDQVYPTRIYGMCKHFNDKMAQWYCETYGMSIIGVRPGNLFGHGRKAALVAEWFSGLISKPAVGEAISLNVDSSATFCLIYVKDVIRVIRILLDAASPRYNLYNTGGWTISLGELADTVRQFIPTAKIEFKGGKPGVSLPTKVSQKRLTDEFEFSLMPLRDAVLDHINCAREEAGLGLLNKKKLR